MELNALAEAFDLVWVDDEVGRDDQTFFPDDHQLVHGVDPRTGLTTADFTAIRDWASRNSFADKAFRPHD